METLIFDFLKTDVFQPDKMGPNYYIVLTIVYFVVHFCGDLDKCPKSCSEFISIAAAVRTPTVRCLFVRNENMLTWF